MGLICSLIAFDSKQTTVGAAFELHAVHSHVFRPATYPSHLLTYYTDALPTSLKFFSEAYDSQKSNLL